MTWQLRRAGAADLDAIMALEQASFENDAWSRDSMRRELANPHCYYLVAVDAEAGTGLVEGYAGLSCPVGSTDADIQTIAVAERSRGRGLGRQLMGRLLDEAMTRRAKTVFLEVRADNPVAHALYVSLGFADIAVRPNYYQPDGVDAIVMRAELPAKGPALAAGSDTTADGGREGNAS
ncbi:ribosomal protein S18-alanine N-acetyltransferase [Herbiconiux ginsengi]|uniref:[SSU ribosomal protein S18P]-alanine acetyltransferase n=1 Tax=Herbiconiux ginsengi TaxID=381665 RepID=A0A1H3JWR3_9MICO|nr:ribosomal protein S18-alanine N-acetyltransferase [Herbiconiux ginsengi]SDY44363.1 [SSU ribosomal protein S18P]-alanine acetyltransferase [Herbiconiux ginsengi]